MPTTYQEPRSLQGPRVWGSGLGQLLCGCELQTPAWTACRLLAEEPALYAMSSTATLTYKSDSNSTAEDLHNMTVKASAWTLGIMLLITLYGAVYCMFGMDFKRDTLLFGAPKTRAD